MSAMEASDRSFGERATELAGLVGGFLGWLPDQFWGATPDEIASALGAGREAGESIDRVSVDRLRAMFPDERG